MTVYASVFKRLFLAAAALIATAMAPLAARTPEAAATLVIFNRNDPDSEDLAKYYAKRRDIPASQVVGLDCAGTEEIHRADYEKSIAKPLLELFKKRGWWTLKKTSGEKTIVTNTKIRFLAIMRGIPLKISHDPTIPPATFVSDLPNVIASRNDASVDSELATLGMFPPEIGGIVPNPYFRRFTPILDNPVYPGMLLPARLDAPTPSIVRAMIDDSLSAEREGLWGWAYVDGRGITSGGLAEGDKWMDNLVTSMRARGIPVIFDKSPSTFPAGYPITDAAVYYGWYADHMVGPFAEGAFRFRLGAIAVHLHSFSASTLHSATERWCGPLLTHGAAATLGNVYEPFLALTANLDIFQDRLMAGFTLAESAYISQKALSWMGIVVGDPLYRPYAVWQNLSKQNSKNVWYIYRNIILEANGDILKATSALTKAAEKTKNSMFLEALGAAQADAGKPEAALASFDAALALKPDTAVFHRLVLEKIVMLRALGRHDDASVLANEVAPRCTPGPRQNLFLPSTNNISAPSSPEMQEPTSFPSTSPVEKLQAPHEK